VPVVSGKNLGLAIAEPDASEGKETRRFPEPPNIDELINAALDPRGKAFVALLAKTGARITEIIQLKISDIDFERGALTILHLKERAKLKCPDCGEGLGRKHVFCPGCGNKVQQAIRQRIEQRRQRTLPLDHNTLTLIKQYLEWRQQFSYRGPLLFPFSRQRGWQIVEKLGRRIGITGLHPHSFRHFLATRWVSKGLDIKKLQIFLGHASISTTMEYVDSSFDQLQDEYSKLWNDPENETAEGADK